jgi:phosphate transport system protein
MHRNTPHLDQFYEAEIRLLDNHLVKTGNRAEGMIREAVDAFVGRDLKLARSVVTVDAELNQLEVEADELCVRLLARRSPVGQDLRLVTCALKCVIDLERIGDLSANIAKRTIELGDHPNVPVPNHVQQLAQAAVDLTHRALQALYDRDADAARAVMAEDRSLDELNREIFREMLLFAKDHQQQIEEAFAYTSVSRHLERVGDHAVNIAEMVVFLVEGKVVRHMARAGGTSPAATPIRERSGD